MRSRRHPASRTVIPRDTDAAPIDEPVAATSGEIAEYDAHGALRGRTRFFLHAREMPSWIPVGEAAFLLWVLIALVVAWLAVGVVLRLT